MSSHRISAPSQALCSQLVGATQALTVDQIQQALPEADRTLLEGHFDVTLFHQGRPMISGNRAALYVVLKVRPRSGDLPGTPNDTLVLISWTFHNADLLATQPHDLRLILDRIVPVRG